MYFSWIRHAFLFSVDLIVSAIGIWKLIGSIIAAQQSKFQSAHLMHYFWEKEKKKKKETSKKKKNWAGSVLTAAFFW